ncbi:MAG: hypothetical protein ABI832_15675 [bacterium]
MKTILLIATFATLSITAPLHAASTTPTLTLEQLLDGSFDRRGRHGGCDTARDRREHPERCTPV